MLFFVLLAAGCTSADSGGQTSEVAAAEPAPIVLQSCGVGTMLGENGARCVPVGPDELPVGFERVAGVWGFKAINAWGLCPEGSFSVIGTDLCRAVDHTCAEEFPPSGMTLVHDQAELVAALGTSAPGATIALADGTYDGIVIDRDVNLLGRCSKRVTIRGDKATGRAVTVVGPRAVVTLSALTVSDAKFGISAREGAKVHVERTHFFQNEVAAWVEGDASLEISHALVDAGNQVMADGVIVAKGGHAELEEMELRDMHVGLQAYGEGSTAKGSSLVISDRSTEPLSGLVVAAHGADIDLDRSIVFARQVFIGGASDGDPRLAGSVPAKLRVTNSQVVRAMPTEAGGFDVGGGSTLELVNDTFETRARVAISAERDATLSLERTVIRPVAPTDPEQRVVGAGLVMADRVRLSIDRSAIMGVSQSAVLASRGCRVEMTKSLIADVWEFTRKGFDHRFDSGQAISLSGDSVLEMSDSALVDNAGAAVWADRGDETTIKIERSVIAATRERTTAAVGALVWSGTFDIRSTLVHGIPSALAFGDVTGAVVDTTLSRGDAAFRFLGESRIVPVDNDDSSPSAGSVATRNNVLVETLLSETNEALPLGQCRCERPAETESR